MDQLRIGNRPIFPSTNLVTKPDVKLDAAGAELIRVRIDNYTGGMIRFCEQDVHLDASVPVETEVPRQTKHEKHHLVLSPQWANANSSGPVIEIKDGESGSFELNWSSWVKEGFWVSSGLNRGFGPWPSNDYEGKVWVRVYIGIHGAIPVLVTEPGVVAGAKVAETRNVTD